MKPVDILIGAAIIAVVILALRSMRRGRQSSCHGCDRPDCPYRR